MTKDTRTRLMFIGTVLVTAIFLAFAVLAITGTNINGIKLALRITARFSFLLFWLAYAGGSLAALFNDYFRWLAQQGRNFGLAFASAHSIHLLLVICLYRLSPEPPISTQGAVFFSIGMLWTYLLAVLSIQYLAKLLGTQWRSIRLVGIEYIMLAFQCDFLPSALGDDAKSLLGYLPFALLGVAGTALRIINWARKTQGSSGGILPFGRLRQ